MSEETLKPAKKIYYDQRSVALRTKQVVYFVQEHDKIAMLDLFLSSADIQQSVIVVNSKKKADELSRFLLSKEIKAVAVHGNHRVEQQKESANDFNSAKVNIIITTDKILETLDLQDIKLVINYNLPLIPQEYYNRLSYMKELGGSVAFVSPEDDKALSAIEANMKAEIEDIELEGFVSTPLPKTSYSLKDKRKKPRHRKVKEKKAPKEDRQK